jgi:hypothetical protein
MGSVTVLREKSTVLPVGIDLPRLASTPPPPQEVPLILWNQRWEYDKNPAPFFTCCGCWRMRGCRLRWRCAGSGTAGSPQRLRRDRGIGERIVHVGYADAEKYKELLWAADVVISTAVHEFFGISILEAIYCHNFPLLPARLSYPELLPDEFHAHCLYETEGELAAKLRWALR